MDYIKIMDHIYDQACHSIFSNRAWLKYSNLNSDTYEVIHSIDSFLRSKKNITLDSLLRFDNFDAFIDQLNFLGKWINERSTDSCDYCKFIGPPETLLKFYLVNKDHSVRFNAICPACLYSKYLDNFYNLAKCDICGNFMDTDHVWRVNNKNVCFKCVDNAEYRVISAENKDSLINIEDAYQFINPETVKNNNIIKTESLPEFVEPCKNAKAIPTKRILKKYSDNYIKFIKSIKFEDFSVDYGQVPDFSDFAGLQSYLSNKLNYELDSFIFHLARIQGESFLDYKKDVIKEILPYDDNKNYEIVVICPIDNNVYKLTRDFVHKLFWSCVKTGRLQNSHTKNKQFYFSSDKKTKVSVNINVNNVNIDADDTAICVSFNDALKLRKISPIYWRD